MRKLCTSTEADPSRLEYIIDNVFLDYSKLLSDSSHQHYSLNGYVAMLSFLSSYCWANLFIIKSNEKIRVKLEDTLIKIIVNAKSVEIRSAAQSAITSFIVNTIFDPLKIIRRLKKLWERESAKFLLSSMVDDTPSEFLNTQSSMYGSLSQQRNVLESSRISVAENNSLLNSIHENLEMADDDTFAHSEHQKDKENQNPENSRQNYTNENSTSLHKLHGISLGFCSLIQSHPYTVPEWLPALILYLNPLAYSKHQIIKSSIRKSISEFKKTHSVAWNDHHKPKFNLEELEALNDMSVNHSYFT